VFYGEGCVAMATAFKENSLLAHRHVEGWTINHYLKSGAVLTLFIGATTTSCFLARDAFPWRRHMVRSQIWLRTVEAWTGDIQAKFGERSDHVHWSYSDIVFYGEGCVSMETAYDDIPSLT